MTKEPDPHDLEAATLLRGLQDVCLVLKLGWASEILGRAAVHAECRARDQKGFFGTSSIPEEWFIARDASPEAPPSPKPDKPRQGRKGNSE